MSDTLLDATGLRCPLPVLKARKTLKPLAPGSVLVVRTTDPSAPGDFEAFCETAGHALLESSREGEIYVIRLRKGD